ncbi:uncharacterized protein LOC141911268 isoform X2 [Tubulanus polymorphus]
MAQSNPEINAENSEIVQIGDKMAESNPGINVENAEIAQIGATNTINYTRINQCCHQDKQGIDRPPQNLDVTQVRECLEETYKQMIDVEYYREVWWSDKFINFHDFFTREHVKIRPRKRNPLSYEESEEQSVILPDDFKELFAYDQRAMKRVCLVGEPGMGKTTQIINLVLSWTSSPTKFLKEFPMLFYIPLNDLPADNACIYKYIFENLINQEIKKNLTVDSFKRFVRENAEKAMFFLDGFDELKHDEAKKRVIRVTNELPKVHIVITTRESGGSMIVTNPRFTIASISGFKTEEVIDIMKRKFPQRDADELFDLLRSKASPLFQSIYYNPLILYMFCFLYMDKDEITIPSKLTDIYIDLTCFLISKRDGIDLSSECFFRDIEYSETFKEICLVAYETLIARQNSFSENRLKPDESKMTALTCKEMSPRQKSDRSVQLRFIHKSVQEFMAAVHSVVQFNESGETPWKKCSFDKLPEELEQYGELYPRFMAGLLHRYKHNRGLGELFKTLIDRNLKAVTIDELNHVEMFNRRSSFLMSVIPDYERFIELRSESYVLSYELSIYLHEADWPDDAIAEIVHNIGKMLIVRSLMRFEINTLAKILEHKQCPTEVVYLRDPLFELKPGGIFDDEYSTLATAMASNTCLQGMIAKTDTNIPSPIDKHNPYLTLCQKSNSMNWFVCLDGHDIFGTPDIIYYKKLEREWIRMSRVITPDDEDQLISRVTSTQHRQEILFIENATLSAKLLGDIQKSHPFLNHLSLFDVSPDSDDSILGELTNMIPKLKSIHILDKVMFDENLTGKELDLFNAALKSSAIETIQLDLVKLTTNQSIEISDSVGSMPKLKHLTCHATSNLQIGRVLGQMPRLTVLLIDLLSEADGDALVRYLSSDAVNELREVGIISYLDRAEQCNAIVRQLKSVSSLRRLEFLAYGKSLVTQGDIDIFVELIENRPHLSDLYIRYIGSDQTAMKYCIRSEIKKINKRVRIDI